MSTNNLGHVTAYGYAKSKGYVGSEAQFAQLMADFANAANTAVEAAEDAKGYKNAAAGSASDASTAAGNAQSARDNAGTSAIAAAASAQAAEQAAADVQMYKGAPMTAATAADMTDTDHVYVYTGSEVGYTSGNWYYYNGASWASGGVYNSAAVQTDPTLSVANVPADAAATGEIKSAVNAISPTPTLTWILNRNVDATGNISTNNYMAVTAAIPASLGDLILRKTPDAVDSKSLIGYLSEFNGDTFIRRSTYNTYGQTFTITDPETTNIRIAFGRASSSGVQISQTDVDNYFDVDIRRKAVTYLDGLVNRGSISVLGYTAISQCADQGYYVFFSSDVENLTDLPLGWTGGGLVTVYKNGNTIWQKIERLTDRCIRYGLTGKWYRESDLVYAKYDEIAGDDDSVERLDIRIPRTVSALDTMYRMGRCVNAGVNANVWRIICAYRETTRKITIGGEWECALHLEGRDDFSGGIVHGDEVDTSVTVFVDGTVTSMDSLDTLCHEIKIVRHSNLYDPNDHTTVIAEHGVEYVFNTDGLTINQSVEWKETESLTNCYLAMLPIAKAYSTHRYDDTSFDIVENDQSSYSVTIPKARSVTEFNTDYDTFVTMAVQTYPTGFAGGDCALITDNGGKGYNKVYFPVCSSGMVHQGDVWKSTTIYKNR